ncbi:MAG TPA: glutamate-5-semialdehyde dehydrogenase [Candidatus Saccharimonadales bacterium]|nr:glutamate-5-semialdehyde dehydrogenase [Candidatus Saccharimonadales bacterium]
MNTNSTVTQSESIHPQVEHARKAARALAGLSGSERNQLLLAAAAAMESHSSEIVIANREDCEALAPAVAAGSVAQALAHRLRTSPAGVKEMAARVRDVATLEDPLAHIIATTELDEGLVLDKVACPLGIIAVVFESRPDVVPQVASLAIKSGNGLVLKGGAEARHTNRVLVSIWHEVLAAHHPGLERAICLFEDRAGVMALLQMQREIDLVVPRGSTEFVDFVFRNSRIPVLGHGSGICHIYVDSTAEPGMACKVVLDSKTQYPAACNSVEKVLVHAEIAGRLLPELVRELEAAGVEVRGCERTRQLCGNPAIKAATEDDWSAEYGDLIVTLKVVDDLEAAMAHIDQYGSRHTECIITEDAGAAARFLDEVDAASVFHNASTRFADGFRYGLGAEIGISNSKLHARGPVGIEGLLTYKYKLRGRGQVVSDYVAGKRKFIHRKNHRAET